MQVWGSSDTKWMDSCAKDLPSTERRQVGRARLDCVKDLPSTERRQVGRARLDCVKDSKGMQSMVVA